MSTKPKPFPGLDLSHLKAAEPSSSILDRFRPYAPSWTHIPRTTWTDRLGGHYGLVGAFAAVKR